MHRLRRAQWAADSAVLERKQAEVQAAEEAARVREDQEAAHRRWWQSWMAVHHPDGRDPLQPFFDLLEQDPRTPERIACIREDMARYKAKSVLGQEPDAAELAPFVEEEERYEAFSEAFRAKHGRHPHWLDYHPSHPPWRLPSDAITQWIENYRWSPTMGHSGEQTVHDYGRPLASPSNLRRALNAKATKKRRHPAVN
jgi:hypothetical protein